EHSAHERSVGCHGRAIDRVVGRHDQKDAGLRDASLERGEVHLAQHALADARVVRAPFRLRIVRDVMLKHYVANDSETERRTYDARISEGVLRELYLAPFEACVAEAGVFLIMAAYNSVNGATMTANAPLVRGVLKG